MVSRRVLVAVLLIVAVLAAEWVVLRLLSTPPGEAGGPVVAAPAAVPGGPFSLVDHRGDPVSDADFRGKYLVLAFGYTFCPDVCPTTLNAIAGALDLLGPRADSVQALFVTVDPERDTPAVLAAYVAAFHPGILGLTGTSAQVGQVLRDYRVYAAKAGDGGADYLVDHSAFVYLVGPDGGMLAYLKPDATAADLARALAGYMAGPGA